MLARIAITIAITNIEIARAAAFGRQAEDRLPYGVCGLDSARSSRRLIIPPGAPRLLSHERPHLNLAQSPKQGRPVTATPHPRTPASEASYPVPVTALTQPRR